ncbi:MAG: Stk1 family PASTA domain-containing Ser/Thr kinase [Actinomycetota bacterium]
MCPRPLTRRPHAGGRATSSRTQPDPTVRIPETKPSLTTLDGRYHVLDRLAAGGVGEVFRAHDAVLVREVAVKVLHPNLAGDLGFVNRFRREARAAAGLNHPNIVGVHDWGAVDGVYFMVMEFVRGQSLREILNAQGVLAPAQAADVLLQVLAALDHAHRKGIVHRDIKPENVMVAPDGAAKVTDFGLARAYADGRVTQAGAVTGTPQYLAPEQLHGEPADPRTDLYSLGIVAFELLTGRVPFEGETSMAIAYRHIRDRVPRPSARNPSVPPGLDGWVASMTEKDRELRPESAAEARRDLAAEAASFPPAPSIGKLVQEAPEPSPSTDPRRARTVAIPRGTRAGGRRGRRRTLGVLFALLAVAGAAWGAWTYLVPHSVDVPRVIGMRMDEAQARLNDLELTVTIGEGEFSLRVPTDHVLVVQPPPGTNVREGTNVTLTPSLGPPPVPVPDLIGKTVPEAQRQLKEARLRLGERRRAHSDRFAVGEIMEQSVPGTDQAPQGSAIDVVVSKGPSPEPVPKVIGKSEEQARGLLAAWVVKKETRYSDAVPRGVVIDQGPNPKTELQPGQAVTIVVSLGPKFVEVPNLEGMSKDDAVAGIRELGLIPQVNQVPGSNGDTVVGQLPEAGGTVRAGSTITIYVA